MKRETRVAATSPQMSNRTGRSERALRGFTLVEVLVVIAIIAMLLSLLAPAVSQVRARARGFDCQMNLRGVSFDFHVFADADLHGNRGDDETEQGLGRGQFRLETFQESQYRIDEFWAWPGTIFTGSTSALGAMSCPGVSGEIVIRSDTPCSAGAVQPPQNIAYTFNLRLDRPERQRAGKWITVPEALSERVLSSASSANIPLVWDADGALAKERDISPHYSAAPTGGSERPYSDGWTWFPGLRHGGEMNVGFPDGSVRASTNPLQESGWDWDWQQPR